MELCEALALRMVRKHPTDPTNPFLDHELHTDLDVNHVCRNRMLAVEPSLVRDFYCATPIQMAALAGEEKVVMDLIQRGARVDAPVTGGNTPLLLALSRGQNFSSGWDAVQHTDVDTRRAIAD
jgi:ankyrin repeat protein